MQNISKVNALMRDLVAALQLRFANSASINYVRQTADSNNWPMAFCSVGGNEAEGQPVIGIRLSQLAVPAPDVFGNQQYAYSPAKLEIAYELAASGAPTPIAADLFKAMFESTNTGVAIYQEEVPHGTAVTAASMIAANQVSELNNLYWANKGV